MIRKAREKDLPKLKEFQQHMAFETEGLTLNDQDLEKGLKVVLSDANKGYYFVAQYDQETVGCLMVTPEWSDWRNGTVWWIQSVYVDKEYRRKGIYRKLYSHIQEWVKSEPSYKGIRLYVEKENTTAQQVYADLGMDGEHYKLFEWMK